MCRERGYVPTYQLRVSFLEVVVISQGTHRSAVLYNILQDICSVAAADGWWINRHCVCVHVYVYGQSEVQTIITSFAVNTLQLVCDFHCLEFVVIIPGCYAVISRQGATLSGIGYLPRKIQ